MRIGKRKRRKEKSNWREDRGLQKEREVKDENVVNRETSKEKGNIKRGQEKKKRKKKGNLREDRGLTKQREVKDENVGDRERN